jgi:hypothetical protein
MLSLQLNFQKKFSKVIKKLTLVSNGKADLFYCL